MGHGHTYTCKCGSERQSMRLGIGMMYPRVCEKVYEAALAGEYGEAWKETVENNPTGGFDCAKVVYKCPNCDYWEIDTKKSYYVPVDGYDLKGRYISWFHRAWKDVKWIKNFRHICPECSHLMHIADLEKETLVCHECKAELDIELGTFCWD